VTCPELFGFYGNAHTTGTISLVTLERVCDEVLGWHPRMPYDKVLRPSHPPTPAVAVVRSLSPFSLFHFD
jgi:hypothetical protein